MLLTELFTPVKTVLELLAKPFKRHFDRPKIYIDVKRVGGGKKHSGPIIQAPILKDDQFGEVYDGNNATTLDYVEWKYQMRFLNNSEFAAYNIKIIEPEIDSNFKLEPKIDGLKPILPNTEATYTAIFSTRMASKEGESYRALQATPDLLLKNKIILEYTNLKGRKYYTIFDFSKEDELLRNDFAKKPKHQ